jgi:hypothetical protein
MESVNDVSYKQCAAVEFLVTENESVGNIYRSLCNVYGSATVDRSNVGRWDKRMTASETGKAALQDLPLSDSPVTAVCTEMLKSADAIIGEDRRITTRQTALSVSISKGSVNDIICDIGY